MQTVIERQRSFVADASHQLRNPLTALRLRVENLEHHLAPGGQTTLSNALMHVDKLSSLTNSLLTVARLEQHGSSRTLPTEGEVATIDVAEVCTQRCEEFLTMLSSRSSLITLSWDGSSPTLAIARPHALDQVLDVLLDNAMKFSPPNGHIEVRVHGTGPFVDVSVTDEGPGMTAEERVRATDRFWRGAGTQHIPGTGLGLSIAKLLVTSSGGTLEFLSRASGGLEVRVRLAAANDL